MAGIVQRLRFTMQCPSTPRRMAARWCCRPSSLPLALALTAVSESRKKHLVELSGHASALPVDNQGRRPVGWMREVVDHL